MNLDRAWAARPQVLAAAMMAAYRKSPVARRARRRRFLRRVAWVLICAALVLILNLIGRPCE